MKNKQVKSKLIYSFLTLLLLITVVIGGRGVYPAYAATSGYSDVLTDLQKSEEFKVADYPDNPKDYAIKVIQIAESTAGELFLYTYQPCQKTTYLVATEINMSLNESADGTKLYDLALLNSNGVFCKYKVEGVTVSTSATRYYNLTSIYRKYLKGIDEETDNDNVINGFAIKVAQLWTVTTLNGNVTYRMETSEVIEISQKYVGMLRYSDGYWFAGFIACDSHYIAFSTDKHMDKLLSADIYYKSRTVERHFMLGIQSSEKYGDEQETTTRLNSDDLGSNSPRGWFSEKKSWYVIQQANAFIEENQDLNAEAVNNIKNKQWVIRFTETSFKKEGDYKVNREVSSEVTDVTILRLEFETDGKVYNLGVVDNKQTGSNTPDNEHDGKQGVFEYIWNCIVKLFTGKANVWEIIIAVVVLLFVVVLVVLAVKFIKFVIRGIFK